MVAALREIPQARMIDTDRYEILNARAQGCWGTIVAARDREFGNQVAIKILNPAEIAKEQMLYRGTTGENVMKNEAIELTNAAHLVPRKYEIDNNGVPFVVMPWYDQDLKSLLRETGFVKSARVYVGQEIGNNKTFSRNDAIRYWSEIAAGAQEFHKLKEQIRGFKKKKRLEGEVRIAHGDLKFDNCVLDHWGKVLLTDFGASTIADYEREGPRDHMGWEYIRARELFFEGNKPTKRSDYWSLGALGFRLFTGEYPLESRGDLESLHHNHTVEEVQKMINEELRNAKIPRKIKRVIRDCLKVDHNKRYRFNDLSGEIEKANTAYLADQGVQTFLRKTLPTFLGSVLAISMGITTCATIKDDTIGHNTDSVRTAISYVGETFPIGLEHLIEREEIPALSSLPNYPISEDLKPMHKRMIKHLNPTIIELAEKYRETCSALQIPPEEIVNENQVAIGVTYFRSPGMVATDGLTGPDGQATVSVIHGLGMSQVINGYYDLEDACTIARLGEAKFHELRRVSGKTEFADYINAQNPDGTDIVSKTDRELLLHWLKRIDLEPIDTHPIIQPKQD